MTSCYYNTKSSLKSCYYAFILQIFNVEKFGYDAKNNVQFFNRAADQYGKKNNTFLIFILFFILCFKYYKQQIFEDADYAHAIEYAPGLVAF